MQALFQNMRFAIRQLRKSPGFLITVVLTLSLGIGANTAIFTLVQGILLRSLPVTDPSRLYRIGDTDECCVEGGFPGDGGDFSIFSNDLYLHLKNAAPEFEQLAAVEAGPGNWSVRRGGAASKSLGGEFVSGNYFATLGLSAYRGRLFADGDDEPSATPAAVLSYPAWKNEFLADPTVVGSTIYIQAKPFSVIGVAPPGFFGDRITDSEPDFWMPIQTEPYVRGDSSILNHHETHWLYPLGRVRTGTNIPALEAKLTSSLQQWLNSRPLLTANGGDKIIPKQHVTLSPGGGGIQNLQIQTGTGLKMLMILSSVVLLIACANIANLMLARATTRRSEVAVRMAMGATRGRVVAQVITESILLGCIGGAVGLAVAYGGSRTILALAFPEARNLPVDANPSLPVLCFAFAVSLLTGILFGSGPAWLSSHAQPADVLRGSNRSTRDRSSIPQRALVVFQAALSLVLLAGAVLLTRSLANLENQKFGVATHNRYVFNIDPEGAGYTIDKVPALYRQIEDRFAALPGVANASLAIYTPLQGSNWGECVIQQGHPAPGPNSRCGSTWDRVSTRFLDSIGVPIVRGRDFNEHDTNSSPQVAIVNQAFVKRFFPNQDPIGQHFGIDMPQYSGAWQIVGVFADFKMNNPRDPARPLYLRPLSQRFMGYKESEMNGTEIQSMFIRSMIVNFSKPQSNTDALIRQTLASIDPNLTITNLRTLDAQVAGNFNGERLTARLTGLFGLLALILASVGLYGVMSYFVARRTSEIGIRMALGATRKSVVSMVLLGALVQIGLGLALGIPASLFAGHLMATQLYGVGAYDPFALIAATTILAVCAAFAGWLPARRAASIEPMKALKTE